MKSVQFNILDDQDNKNLRLNMIIATLVCVVAGVRAHLSHFPSAQPQTISNGLRAAAQTIQTTIQLTPTPIGSMAITALCRATAMHVVARFIHRVQRPRMCP